MEIKDAYKFCPVCGTETEKKTKSLHCNNCGHNIYFNPKPTVVLILYNDKNEILLTERAIDPQKGLLDTPGGFVDDRETFEQAATRELKEELNLEINNFTYLSSSSDEYLFGGINYINVNAVFLAKIDDTSKIKAADDVASFNFYPADNLPYEKFAFKSMKKELDLVRKYLEN